MLSIHFIPAPGTWGAYKGFQSENEHLFSGPPLLTGQVTQNSRFRSEPCLATALGQELPRVCTVCVDQVRVTFPSLWVFCYHREALAPRQCSWLRHPLRSGLGVASRGQVAIFRAFALTAGYMSALRQRAGHVDTNAKHWSSVCTVTSAPLGGNRGASESSHSHVLVTS